MRKIFSFTLTCSLLIVLAFGYLALAAAQEGFTQNLHILVVDKAQSRLNVFKLKQNKLQGIKIYPAISGKRLGDKKATGDLRTPEGIYFFVADIPSNRLQKKHGKLAVSTNYPNPMDVNYQKTGYGIWLHGVESDERILKKFDTEGCVAMKNEDVAEVRDFIHPQLTPILIFDDLQKVHKDLIPDVLDFQNTDFVFQWAKAWQEKDMDTYGSLYSDEFKAGTKDFKKWLNYKSSLAKKYKNIRVKIEYPIIFKHPKYHVALFYQDYQSSMFRSKGLKRLYLKPGLTADGKPKYQILNEEFIKEGTDLYLPYKIMMTTASQL